MANGVKRKPMPVASDYRLPLGPITAWRLNRPLFGKVVGSNPAAKKGLTYERSVKRQLERHVKAGNFIGIDYNPWFTWTDAYGTGHCSPDILLRLDQGLVVVEVKLTWVQEAMAKLDELYCPVIAAAHGLPVRPLVICRHVTAHSPKPSFSLSTAIRHPPNLLQWMQNGNILW